MHEIKICPKCRSLVHWNSYFQLYICSKFLCDYAEMKPSISIKQGLYEAIQYEKQKNKN